MQGCILTKDVGHARGCMQLQAMQAHAIIRSLGASTF